MTSRVSTISRFWPPRPGAPIISNPGLALAGAAGALGSLDTALNIAFPDLVDSLGITVGDLQWVVVSYVLAYGGLLLAAGQLADRIGHRRMLNLGASGTIVAMTGCALAPNFAVFLVARTFQGLVTAMVMAAAPAMATLAATGRRSGGSRGVGTFQSAAGFGAALGPLIGGPLVLAWGWPSVFWFRIPLCLAIVVLARSVTEADRPTRSTTDVGGAILVTVALTTLLLAVNSSRSFGSRSLVPWAALGVAALVGTRYVTRARRHPAPLIDPALFADRRFAVANLLSVLANGAMFVSWLLVPTLLVTELGYPAVVGGLALAASPIAMGITSVLAGRWGDRTDRRLLVVAGLGLEAVGLGWLATGGDSAGVVGVVGVTAAMAVVGSGLGLFGVPNMAMVMERLADSRQGTAGGLALTTRTAGIVAGVSGSAALFDHLEPSRGFLDAYRLTTMASAAVAVGAALLAVSDYWARNRVRPAVA